MQALALRPIHNPLEDFVERHRVWFYGGLTVAGAFATGALVAAVARRLRPAAPQWPTYPDPFPRNTGVPFAEGDPNPAWPVGYTSRHNRLYTVSYKDVNGTWHGNPSRAFKVNRPSRWHVGMDLYANPGDPVVAPEDGTVVRIQTFFSGTDAMLIQGDRGVTVLLGEIKRNSPREFGITKGSRVQKGQTVARVGQSNSGSHMLHFETYACCPNQNQAWYKGKPPPSLVLDPTDYLLRARAALRTAAA